MEFNILVVDDDEDIYSTCEDYVDLYNVLKVKSSTIQNSNIRFHVCASIKQAIELLDKNEMVFNAMLVDFYFNNSGQSVSNGIHLINLIREKYNTRIQILFNTMHPLTEIGIYNLFNLCNSSITRFILKDSTDTVSYLKNPIMEGFQPSDQIVVEALIDALTQYSLSDNPICNGLELLLTKYKNVGNDIYIEVDGKKYSVDEILKEVRLDTLIGKRYIEILVQQSIMSTIKSDKLEGLFEWK